MENNRVTDFIIRYKNIFSRNECREIIELIDFFSENSLLFPQKLKNRPFQDQDASNVMVDNGMTLPTVHKVTSKVYPKIQPCIDKYLEQFPILGARSFIIHDAVSECLMRTFALV